ncbi:MAG: DUF4390 domain-containing protein [bacterium]
MAASLTFGGFQAAEVSVPDVWVEGGELRCSIRAAHVLDDRARETIEQGGTSALDYTVELYLQRSGWFDAMVATRTLPFRISYDAFERKYRLLSEDIRMKSESFQEVADQCTRLAEFSLGRVDELDLEPDGRYYIVVHGRYQPVVTETLEEIRSWLGGPGGQQRREQEREGGGIGSRLARTLMNAAGFGEKELQGESVRFRPADLPER